MNISFLHLRIIFDWLLKRVECPFPIYLVNTASFLSGKKLAPICDASGILYPWYEAVQGGTYWYVPVHPLLDTRRYKKRQNCTYQYRRVCTDLWHFYGSTYWYVLVCTVRYKEVQGGTTKYKEVHSGTRNSTRTTKNAEHKIENYRSNSTWKINFPTKNRDSVIYHRKWKFGKVLP